MVKTAIVGSWYLKILYLETDSLAFLINIVISRAITHGLSIMSQTVTSIFDHQLSMTFFSIQHNSKYAFTSCKYM